MRREGLYSSHLTIWRRQKEQGELDALAPKKRGRKSTANPLAEENQRLRKENARLSRRLEQAELIIDVPKKVSALLGISLPETKTGEENSGTPPTSSAKPWAGRPPAARSTCRGPHCIATFLHWLPRSSRPLRVRLHRGP